MPAPEDQTIFPYIACLGITTAVCGMNSSFLLIGHRTSGKSVLGRQLAEARGIPFVDLDEAIEAREGRPAAELVGEDEPRFRHLEQDVLREICDSPGARVIATGGGC